MVDIHSHILPGLDDGARTLDEALAIVRVAAERGTTDIVATPHANPSYPFDACKAEEALGLLRRAVPGAVRIHYGCELHLTPENIDDALLRPARYAIGHRGYVLVEFSNLLVPRTSAEIFGRFFRAGVRPIIAHPERNPLLRQRMDELKLWVERGCLLQVTAQSLLGQFGDSSKEAGHNLIAQGLAHCVASDTHDATRRPPGLNVARRAVEERFGSAMARRLFEENPRAVLNGVPIAEGPVAAKRTWYRFW